MAIQPDPADDHSSSEESDYRFVVLRHPELGEFLNWDVAVAAAWEVTPAGHKRAEVTLAQKGVQQVRLDDSPMLSNHLRDPLTLESTDFFVPGTEEPQTAHTAAKIYTDPSSMIAHCGRIFTQPRPATLLDKRCQTCADMRASVYVRGARVVDWSKSHPDVHIVERAHLHKDHTYVQFHCNIIMTSQTLKRVTVIPDGRRMCETCFDLNPRLSFGSPPLPAGW